MVRSLRQRHRVMVFALSAFLPAAFVLGIVSRRPVPVAYSLPGALPHHEPQADQTIWLREDLWETHPLRTRLLADAAHSALAVEVTAHKPIVRPDLLLYWVLGNAKIDDSPPDDAVLLGAWMQDPANPLPLPPAVKTGPGKLILYSLADHEIVNVSKPFAIQ